MHGGISERLTSLSAINDIDRRKEPDNESLLADLLWADPVKDKLASSTYFKINDDRGISCFFGLRPLQAFL